MIFSVGGGGQSGQSGWSQGPQTQRNYGEGRGPRGGAQRPKGIIICKTPESISTRFSILFHIVMYNDIIFSFLY